MMARLKNNQYGIGLIEVMVTLVIISIGILALVNFQSFAFRSAAVASNRATAISIAQDKLAKLRTFTSIEGQSNTLSFQQINGVDDVSKTAGNLSYTLDVDVKNYCYSAANSQPSGCPTSQVPDLKRVKITVNWSGVDGDGRDFVLSSFIASIDPASAGQLYN